MDTWQPTTPEELDTVVARQLLDCTPAQRAAFTTFRVPYYAIPVYRLSSIESVLVVAKLPSGLLYFEDVEEGFEVGVPDKDGILPDQGCNQYELTHVLYRAGL